jgi:hypothetical protein
VAEAEKPYREAAQKILAAPTKARDAARKALEDKVNALTKDEAAKIKTEVKDLEKQLAAVQAKIKVLGAKPEK